MTKLLILTITFSLTSYSMIRALNTAATGMASGEAHVNTISNNIANANTTAYKMQRAEFEDLKYETVKIGGARSSASTQYTVGEQIGSGSRVNATRRIHSMGSPQMTQRPYDLMIMGDGFFAIQNNGETFYTRDGGFTVDSQGIIKTRDGYTVVPGITIPTNTAKLNIANDGMVEAFVRNQLEPIQLGQIPVFTFINPAGLHDFGGNKVRMTTASGEPIQNIAGTESAGSIQQGTLESSNVSIMNEMTNLIKAQRGYEMNSKVMGVADQMLQTVNNIR